MFEDYPIDEASYVASGSFGYFYRVGENIGVKVIYTDSLEGKDTIGFDSKEELYNSNHWKGAEQEAELIQRYDKYPWCPDFYGLFPVLKDGRWWPGLFVEFIEGRWMGGYFLSEKGQNFENMLNALDDFRAELRECGVDCWDVGGNNVIVRSDGSFALIDYTPKGAKMYNVEENYIYQ